MDENVSRHRQERDVLASLRAIGTFRCYLQFVL